MIVFEIVLMSREGLIENEGKTLYVHVIANTIKMVFGGLIFGYLASKLVISKFLSNLILKNDLNMITVYIVSNLIYQVANYLGVSGIISLIYFGILINIKYTKIQLVTEQPLYNNQQNLAALAIFYTLISNLIETFAYTCAGMYAVLEFTEDTARLHTWRTIDFGYILVSIN